MALSITSADERRQQIQAHAFSIGITEGYIRLLVTRFYGKVGEHPTLGPIFKERLGGDWQAHLDRMVLFWSSVALNSGQYSGKPVPAHQRLKNVSSEHFKEWLSLFHTTLGETAPSPDVVPYFMERAERIAQSLQYAMFGLPSLVRDKGA